MVICVYEKEERILSQLFMRRPNLGGLPVLPTLPAGSTLRVAVPGDADAIAALLQSAFFDEVWTSERVASVLLEAPDVAETYLIERGGELLATASARIAPEFPHSGYLHWVAVAPAAQGQRLGFDISLAVLRDFAKRGCADAILETDDHRLAAIKTYQNLGFVPEPRHASHPERWAEALANLAAAINL